MTPLQLISYYGSQTDAAKALGLSQPTIAEWKKNGKVPNTRQCHIELVTNGELKADIPADGIFPRPKRSAAQEEAAA